MSARVEMIGVVTKRLLWALVGLVSVLLLMFFLSPHVFGRYPILPVVMLIGMTGGFISLQRRLKTLGEDDIDLLRRSIPYTLLSPFVGGLLAVVLYFMFIAGLLGGDLFPSFSPDPHATDRGPGLHVIFEVSSENPKDYAKLFFWSFLAGFSESFVVDIIGRFDDKGRNTV